MPIGAEVKLGGQRPGTYPQIQARTQSVDRTRSYHAPGSRHLPAAPSPNSIGRQDPQLSHPARNTYLSDNRVTRPSTKYQPPQREATGYRSDDHITGKRMWGTYPQAQARTQSVDSTRSYRTRSARHLPAVPSPNSIGRQDPQLSHPAQNSHSGDRQITHPTSKRNDRSSRQSIVSSKCEFPFLSARTRSRQSTETRSVPPPSGAGIVITQLGQTLTQCTYMQQSPPSRPEPQSSLLQPPCH